MANRKLMIRRQAAVLACRDNTADPLTCPVCGFTAKSKGGLASHVRSHK